MGFKKNNKNNQQVQAQEQKKTGLKAAFGNAKENVCNALDSVSARDGVCVGVGTAVGLGLAYGAKKYVDRKAASAVACEAEEEFVDRRRRA